ncbi:MAG: PD-(D/E)XK nuclease family protein [Endomicrobium sp.]|jgi:hypothetical protein|nr:PD-(D/E)XK nuclease family protein [Endomicrobium sp.]
MSGKIINIAIEQNIIDYVADYIFNSNKRTAIVGGGRRFFLFIKNVLAKKYRKAFFAPEFFTNEEFVERIVFDTINFIKIPDIEAAFIIFEIIKNNMPYLLNNNFSFVSFMDWAFEIFFFIEQLDLENVSNEKLRSIKTNVEIGYDVPENINNLLKDIFEIRNYFHDKLEKTSKITTGYSFLKAVSLSYETILKSFDEIVFVTPFYLYKTEIEIFKKFYNTGKLVVFIQGSPQDYSILYDLYNAFGEVVPKIISKEKGYKLNIYSTFDEQSQGSLLKNLLRTYTSIDLNKTIVVVPDSSMLQSVISEISVITDDYNIAIGYPVHKTVVFSLLNSVIEAQLSKKGQFYYSKDIMKVLTNPLFKNIDFFGESAVSRIIAHKIEQAFDQNSKSSLSGKMFVSFEEIIDEKNILYEISLVMQAWKHLSYSKIVSVLREIFDIFFISWGKINNFNDLFNVLSVFLEKIYLLSYVKNYPLNIEAMDILFSLSKELKIGQIAQTQFGNEEVLNIFKKLIKDKRINLSGFPLKSLQVLGLLESRGLAFDDVFIVGMKDSIIPAIKKEYSLIPKDIMCVLGIGIVQKEYEIQKYHFDRLTGGAKNLNLIYSNNDKDERSRFIESIIWNKQYESRDISAIKVKKFVLQNFSVKQSVKREYEKTKKIKEYLKNMSYTYSKIDVYLNCRLKFYFMYVLLLNEDLEVWRELSSVEIGKFIHRFLKETLYENLNKEELETHNFEKKYLQKLEEHFDNSVYFKFREDAFTIKDVLFYRMKKILEYEKQRKYKSIYGCEKKYTSYIETNLGKYILDCKIDRIDKIDSDSKDYMIFDYKTGLIDKRIVKSKFNSFSESENNFSRQDVKKSIKSLQLPLYKYIFEKFTGFTVSECGLYDIRNAQIINFPKNEEIYMKSINMIKALIDEINSGDSFKFAMDDRVNCDTCKYFYICI